MSQQCNLEKDKELTKYECRSLAAMIMTEARQRHGPEERHYSRFGNAEELRRLRRRACAKGDLLEVVF